MKKSFFLITAFLLLAFSTQAQFKLGVKGGPSLVKYRGTENPTQAILAFHLGAFANFAFSDHFSFQPELLFSKQGAKADTYNNIFLNGTLKDNLSYLAVPLLAKYNTGSGLNFEGGFQLGYLMKGTQSYEYPNNPTNLTSEDADLKEEEILVNGDVSLLLGAGFELPSGLSINFRSVIGLTNINVQDGPALPPGTETYNLAFQLSLGFPLIAL